MVKRLLIISSAILVLGMAGWLLYTWRTAKPTADYDVIVVGAGPSGVAASIQAARDGVQVLLLEETDWIGGQMTTAAVGTMDEGMLEARQSGLYKEFYERATKFYADHGISSGTCYYDPKSFCVAPRDGQKILRAMLGEHAHNLHVKTGERVASVQRKDSTVTGLTTDKTIYTSRVVIEASEYGDVLALSDTDYRVGKSTSKDTNKAGCVQQITYSAVIKYYPFGVPQELVMREPPPGYDKNKAHFAAVVSKKGYDYLQEKRHPVTFDSFAFYRGMPDAGNPPAYQEAIKNSGLRLTRTGVNSPNDHPYKGTMSVDYIEDLGFRAKTNCEAKLLTLQFIYFLQHELDQKKWSIASDEGYDTPYNIDRNHCPELDDYRAFEKHMPQSPYVREARRLIGVNTLTSAHLWRPGKTTDFADSVAVGYYPMDLHGCAEPESLEPDLDPPENATRNEASKSTFYGSSGAFEVPLGALIPHNVDGLLAAEKNISVSRLAEGAIRLQPIAMNVGQAAGCLAAEAVKQNKAPRSIDAAIVRQKLSVAGAIIDTPVKKPK